MYMGEGQSPLFFGNLAFGIGPVIDSKYSRSNETFDAALLTF
jgi:hypothetical protein